LGTQRTWIIQLDWYSLILKTRGNRSELKGLEISDCRHKIESEAIKYLLEARFEISDNASMIAFCCER